MSNTIFRRYYGGKEYRCDAIDDTFRTKRDAEKRAKYWRSRGYNVRIVKADFADNRKYGVYHSIDYAK